MVAELTLPWPPSVNRAYRHVGARVLVSRAGRQFREKVVSIARGTARLKGPLTLTATFHPPDNRRRDLDNLMKLTQDSLQHAGLYDDDSQIRHLHLHMAAPMPPLGMCHVRIEEAGASPEGGGGAR